MRLGFLYQPQSRPFRPQLKFCNTIVNMHGFFALISILMVTFANAMPRYIIIPMENVRFVQQQPMQMIHHRVQRSAWPQDDR